MRIAAGILMIIFAMAALGTRIFALGYVGLPFSRFEPMVFACAAFLVAGGILCLKRKLWGFCLASAVLQLLILYFAQYSGMTLRFIWLDLYFVAPVAILPIIFVPLAKKDWQKSQA